MVVQRGLVKTAPWFVPSVIVDSAEFGSFHLHSRYIVQIHSHFELVSSLPALDATELVSQQVTQMVVELINIDVISVKQKR